MGEIQRGEVREAGDAGEGRRGGEVGAQAEGEGMKVCKGMGGGGRGWGGQPVPQLSHICVA